MTAPNPERLPWGVSLTWLFTSRAGHPVRDGAGRLLSGVEYCRYAPSSRRVSRASRAGKSVKPCGRHATSTSSPVPPDDTTPDRVRLDVWLDVACLFKTRSEAQRACRGGKVDVNDQRAKPHRTIQNGDRVSIARPSSRKQQVVVRYLATHHIPKAAARTLYDDVTPPPTAAEIEVRRLGGAPGGPRRQGSGRTLTDAPRPDTRQRRELRRLKGR